MSGTSGSKKNKVDSHGQDNPGFYTSDVRRPSKLRPPPSGQHGHGEGYTQAYETENQAQRRPSMTGPEDESTRLSSTDCSRHRDHGQHDATMGLNSTSGYAKEGYSGRSGHKEGK